jgi:hypothetical protein
VDPAVSTEGLTKGWGIREVDLTTNEGETLVVPTARARGQLFARASKGESPSAPSPGGCRTSG